MLTNGVIGGNGVCRSEGFRVVGHHERKFKSFESVPGHCYANIPTVVEFRP